MRTVLWFFYFWLSLICLIPKMLKAKRLDEAGDKAARDALTRPIVRSWSMSMLRMAGVTVEASGLENIPDEPVVFVSTHQGYFDIPVLLTSLNSTWPLVAKAELKKLPLICQWMRLLGCVFLERDNPRQSVQALNEAAGLVENGDSVVIFPEGTRSRSDEIGEWKAGALKIAQKSGAKIVPVSIEGSWRAMEGNGNRIRPARICLTVLPPVSLEGLDREQQRALPGTIRESILAARAARQKEETAS